MTTNAAAKPINRKQQLFVDEYLIDLNAKQAAIRAGYSVRRAEVTGCELLSDRKVSESIALRMKEREARTHITADRVLQELARIAFFDLRKLYNEEGNLKLACDLDDDAAAVLSGMETVEEFSHESGRKKLVGHTKKAKVFDKGAALALAMRHLGMLTDKTQLSGPGYGAIQTESTVKVYMPDNGRAS